MASSGEQMVRNQTEMGILKTDKASEEVNYNAIKEEATSTSPSSTTTTTTSTTMHLQLPLESSPYVKYNDLEEYKRHAYVTLPRLQPYHHHHAPPKPSNSH